AAELQAYLPPVSSPRAPREEAQRSPRRPAAASAALSPSAATLGRRTSSGPQRWLLLPPLPRSDYTIDARVQDLVLRMLAAKMQGADAAFLPQPFDDDQGAMNVDASPGELFVPWRTTAALVGGAEYLGPLQLQGGSTGHLFTQAGRAVMAVWSNRPVTEY